MATTIKHSISIVGAGLNFEISIFYTNVAFVCFTFAEISNVAHVEWQTCAEKQIQCYVFNVERSLSILACVF